MIEKRGDEWRTGKLLKRSHVHEVFRNQTLSVIDDIAHVLNEDTQPLSARDRERIVSITHQIKGAAGCHGHQRLGEAAAALQVLAKSDAGHAELTAQFAKLTNLSQAIRPASPERGSLSFRGEGPFRIVLIEDDPSISVLLELCLRESGYRVDSFADGAVALGELQSGLASDLIVLDLMLPGASGWTIIEALRQPNGVGGPPIVVLSASSVPQGPGSELIKGTQAFLRKPFRMSDLQQIIAELLCRE